jgi:hypothetical protein
MWEQEMTTEQKLELLVKQFQVNFYALTLGLYQLYHYCLTRQNEYATLQVLIFLTDLTGMNRAAFSLHGNPISLNRLAPVDNDEYFQFALDERAEEITLMENLVYHTNPFDERLLYNGSIPDAKIRSLDWGLMTLNPGDRAYAVANYTASSIRADQYISMKQQNKMREPLAALATQISYYVTNLEWNRLRNSLFIWQSKKDFTLCSRTYESMLNGYRDLIEWKTEYEIRK